MLPKGKPSPFAGVVVTASQFLPPIIGRSGSSSASRCFFRVDYVMLVASYTTTRNNCKCHARVTNKFLVASRMIPMAKMEKRVSEGWTSSRSRSTRVSYPYWWVFTMAFKLISPDSMAFLMGGAALQPRSVNMTTCIACTMSQDDTAPQVHV